MDAQRTSFVLTIAALLAGTALAEPPSQSAPVRYSGNVPGQSNWSSAGPTTAPTITATPNSRYAYPQATYPQNRAPATTQPQKFGTAGYPAQSNNPFATSQPAAPPASATTGGNLAPPPWPTNSGTLAPPPTSNWDSATPVTPVDRSVLANPPSSQLSNSWTSIGSSIAAPPLIVPQLPTTASSFAPFNTTPAESGPTLTTDSYRGGQANSNSSSSWAQQPASSPTTRTTSPADDWAASWDASANNTNNKNNGTSIGRNANNSSPSGTTRDGAFPSSQGFGSNSQDVRSTVAKPAESSTDDSWSQNSQTPSNRIGASIGASRTAGIGSAGNTAPPTQSPTNAPPFNPQTIGSAGNNANFNGMNSNPSQPPANSNASKPTQPTTATGEPQPWVTLLAAILGLAGSLAGNVYLGWSYLDARQKYQALVRRTADTFRRTKVAA